MFRSRGGIAAFIFSFSLSRVEIETFPHCILMCRVSVISWYPSSFWTSCAGVSCSDMSFASSAKIIAFPGDVLPGVSFLYCISAHVGFYILIAWFVLLFMYRVQGLVIMRDWIYLYAFSLWWVSSGVHGLVALHHFAHVYDKK